MSEKIPIGDVWAVTGHRPDKLPDRDHGYREEERLKVVSFAELILKDLHPREVLAGMALGFDQAIAEACIRLDIPFTACVPFAGQENKWSNPLRKRYAELLSKAKETVIVSPGGYDPKKMHVRNAYMVDRSIALIALWNGSEGGTSACVKYAKDKNHPIFNFWDLYKTFRETGKYEG